MIELLHLAESNHRTLVDVYKIAIDTSKCKKCPLSLNGAESYQQGRADAIDQCIKTVKFHETEYDGICWAIRDLEELKEQNNDNEKP